jgi:hypothetical protein
MITIGIDPGWSSFGIAINQDGKLLSKASFVPKSHGTRADFLDALNEYIWSVIRRPDEIWSDLDSVYIERFVAYSGIQSSASEDILLLIGALDYFFSFGWSTPKLVKAIDWKVRMCQHLVKTKGFSNPGKSLDKKFSLLAAEVLSGEKFKSDHEADAVCLSYLKDEILKVKK